MIIQLTADITAQQKKEVNDLLSSLQFSSREIETNHKTYLVCPESKTFDIRLIGHLAGVADVHIVKDQVQLVSRQWKVEDTKIDLGDGVVISRGNFSLMAGPCSIENEEQVEKTASFLAEQGVKIMRGGVFKPRSSPYAFRGLGIEGLKFFYSVCKAKGIKIITEVMELSQIPDMMDYVDIFQVGARNSQNFNLLDALGEAGKPVLLKRGISGTIEELLSSAEYIFSNGNEKIILCERGIRTYEKAYRNTLDLNAIPLLKEKTHLPVMVDPSHGIGMREHVEAVSLAGVMAGADGLIVEIHECPEKAFSDGQQTLDFNEAAALFDKARKVYELHHSFEMGI
ncbi:MAG: 3-deoxy-7-phosphoheptulonate synthase [Bacteroidetes bacterium]|nr:3-deoxy-7-phosphoheptulonate synthase [Bacteroidota bacterium]